MKIQIISGRVRHDVSLRVHDKPFVVYCAQPGSQGGDMVVEIRVTRPKKGKGHNRSTKTVVVYDDLAAAKDGDHGK